MTYDRRAMIRRHPHGNHVLLNVLSKMNASIEMVSNDVPTAIIRGDIENDVGIPTEQFPKLRCNHRGCETRYEQANTASRFCAGASHNPKALPNFIKGWSQSIEKLFSRFGKGHAARGSSD